MSSDGDGISRVGIASLFSADGHPAALASGPTRCDLWGERKSVFSVMAPTYLSLFSNSDAAAISEDGFCTGNSVGFPDINVEKGTGMRITLLEVTSVQFKEDEPKCLLLGLSATSAVAKHFGKNALTLEYPNQEVAFGWLEALQHQIARAPGLVRLNREADARSAFSKAPLEKTPTGSGNKLFALFSTKNSNPAATTSETAAPTVDYTGHTPWDDRGFDLRQRSNASLLCNSDGNPAVLRFGWLTKRNKSGLRTNVEKERLFVLTPYFLAYFPDIASANIVEGYLKGEAKGEKISGLFTKRGARLPLESACSISFGLKDGSDIAGWVPPQSGEVVKRSARPTTGASPSASAPSVAPGDTTAKEETLASPKLIALRGKLATDSEDISDETSKAYQAQLEKLRSTYFEVDFGEYVLQLNAHSPKNCMDWVLAIKQWSNWQKVQVDNRMLHSLKSIPM